MEGVWGNNLVSGFIAIDDVTFFEGDCDSESAFFEIILKIFLHRANIVSIQQFSIKEMGFLNP